METIYGKQFSGSAVLAPRQTSPSPVADLTAAARPGAYPLSPGVPSSSSGRPEDTGADRRLFEALTRSKVYRDYAHAFSEATGLPIALRPVESWQLPLHGKRHEAPYCAVISERSRACAGCLQMQERLSQAASHQPKTLVCPAGLCETAVPVRLGDRLIAFLQTGQVFAKKPTQRQFAQAAAKASNHDKDVDQQQLKQAYFATRVVSPNQQDSATKLLSIFAEHLAILGNQVVVQEENAEPPVITKAKAYIQEHHTEQLSLGQVARAVNTSTFYFCKMFKKITGLHFTDYVSRIRIEKSRNLLLNPNLRISEIAYEVGFQSLTHFNRMFKRLTGQAPTDYRSRLMTPRAA
jgi:AraC-like DNA-binding protein/ligand-binding sensor protein